MLELLTVCTGNICRSPLAESLLREHLAPLDVRVSSAGTRALVGSGMTPEAQRLADDLGVPDAAAHRARHLTEGLLRTPDLIFAMSREHRRAIVDLSPRRMRATFTVREFARLARHATDVSISRAVADATDPRDALRLAVAQVSAMRSEVEPPADAADDDVIDPYRRSWKTYELSASQLVPAVDEVVRVLRIALA
ncbi:low molecular weight phosphatase family protein [Microbacterium sp.]|jgi:protein-tyrosine phosphatase|uniref:arsenate reductase/protein-tyrosine-phosphatase family protein n=1 Tax=Microbacterium sp. TaxID=51671 RepID=UPI0037C953D5